MAGIGFDLEKLLHGDSFIGAVRAHFYSVVITAGPWILSIVTIFIITLAAPGNLDPFELVFFRTSIVYIFATTLVVTAPLHYPLTRYLADKLYIGETYAVSPVFNSVMLAAFVIQTLIGAAIFMNTSVEPLIKILLVLICLVIAMIWLTMIFLTALKDYRAIFRAYALGSAVAAGGAILLGSRFGLAGYYAGYLAGHLLIAALWSGRVFAEYPSPKLFEPEFFFYWTQSWQLIGIGVFYNAAIWADKAVFWFSPEAMPVDGLLSTFPHYESAAFAAYLTIIPGLSLFLMQIETSFYREYRRYYAAIIAKTPLGAIEKNHNQMAAVLRTSIGFLLRYQGIFSLLAIIFSPQILAGAGLPLLLVPMFRVAVFGAFLHCFLLVTIILILYFDFKGTALLVTFIFFAANAGLTQLTLSLGSPFYGFGYLGAAFSALLCSYYLLDRRFQQLAYYTFAAQPIGFHRDEEIV